MNNWKMIARAKLAKSIWRAVRKQAASTANQTTQKTFDTQNFWTCCHRISLFLTLYVSPLTTVGVCVFVLFRNIYPFSTKSGQHNLKVNIYNIECNAFYLFEMNEERKKNNKRQSWKHIHRITFMQIKFRKKKKKKDQKRVKWTFFFSVAKATSTSIW